MRVNNIAQGEKWEPLRGSNSRLIGNISVYGIDVLTNLPVRPKLSLFV